MANNSVFPVPTMNIIAETTFGDPSAVVMLGAHLDSVLAGPGINDDGSGSASLLEVAIQYSSLFSTNSNKVRFAWWAAEESGLIGSTYYVSQLQPPYDVAVYLNYDMLGSPNYIRGVYNGSAAPAPIQVQSAKVAGMYQTYFAQQNLPIEFTPFTGRSDYGPFIAVNITSGGVFTGADGSKTVQERSLFGGVTNVPYDTCYHLACDTTDNIDQTILLQMTQVSGWILQQLSSQANLRQWLLN